MPRARLFILTLAFLSLTSPAAFAQSSVKQPGAEAITEFDVNGLKVLVKRRPSSPTVAAGLFVRGGARNLTAQNAGIENFMLNVATEASSGFPRATVRREMAATGSSVGAGSNQDYSVISLASTRENFDRSWKIFADLAINPSFTNEDVELVRERLLTVLRDDKDSPEGHLNTLQEKVVYRGHIYANDQRGTVETVGKFRAEDLKAYHKKVMQTSQLLLVVVGDLDAAQLQKQIADTFGKLPRGTYRELPVPALEFSKPTLELVSRPLPTNYVQGVFSAPSINSPDYHAMRVAVSILASRVFMVVRVRNNLSYAPSAEMSSVAANSANISVSSSDANRAVELMLNEMNRLKTEPIEQTDILETSGFFLTNYYMKQETNAAQAAELAQYELNGGGWRNSLTFLERIRKVTPEDIQRVSNKYFRNLQFVVLGKPEAINRSIFVAE